MCKCINMVWLSVVLMAVSAAAQTSVQTSGTTSVGTMPVFGPSSNTTVTNSPISASGSNVGIGTASPKTLLDLGTGYGAGDAGRKISLYNDGTYFYGFSVHSGTLGIAASKTSGAADDVSILSNGSVGIGTKNPGATLHINANGQAVSGYGLMLGQLSNLGNMSVPVNAETSRFEIAFPTYRDVEPNQIGAKIAAIRWNNFGVNNPLIQAIDLAFFTSFGSGGGNTPNLIDTSSEKMRITAAGNIGIGTASPYSTVHVNTNGTAISGHGLMLGQTSYGGNMSVPVNAETARFEIAFPTYRDVEPNQIGAKIAAIRWNNYGANNPLVQAIDLAFFTSTGSDGQNTPNLVDTSNEKMRITATGNVGIGTTTPAAKLDVNGSINLSGSGASITFPNGGGTQTVAWTGSLCGGDYAESVDVSGDRTKYEPGDVLVIDPKAPGKFLKSIEPYSTFVMGIYSTKPGVIGRRQSTPKGADEVPMAMIGIVPTKVSAENGPIAPGDLLVSSSTPGYAMKGTDRSRMFGAVLGKALGSLEEGKGVIEVGVTLQ